MDDYVSGQGGVAGAPRQDARDKFQSGWLSLYHEDDEAIEGLTALQRLRIRLFTRSFALPVFGLMFLAPVLLLVVQRLSLNGRSPNLAWLSWLTEAFGILDRLRDQISSSLGHLQPAAGALAAGIGFIAFMGGFYFSCAPLWLW
jgi:hypothetical protein